MPSEIYKLVNMGLVGEPEKIVLQQPHSGRILEITDIQKVMEDGLRDWDDALDYDRMLSKPSHEFFIHTINGEIILEL